MGVSWLLPLGMKLSSAFQAGKGWVVEKHRLGLTPGKDELRLFLLMEISQVKIPQVRGRDVVETEELDHFAAALAGVIFKTLEAEAQEENHAAF